MWNEADRQLTDAELREKIRYDEDTVYRKYWEKIAADKGVTVDQLTDKEKYQEFKYCNVDCYLHTGAQALYGEFNKDTFFTVPDTLPTDNVKTTY